MFQRKGGGKRIIIQDLEEGIHETLGELQMREVGLIQEEVDMW